jgi:hypothetical protein
MQQAAWQANQDPADKKLRDDRNNQKKGDKRQRLKKQAEAARRVAQLPP